MNEIRDYFIYKIMTFYPFYRNENTFLNPNLLSVERFFDVKTEKGSALE